MDSSKPLSSTTWSDPQLGAKMVFNLLRLWTVYHIRAGKIIKQTDFFLFFILSAQTFWRLFKRLCYFPLCRLFRDKAALCLAAVIASLFVSGEQTSEQPTVPVIAVSVWMCFCAQCKPKSEVQIHWSNTLTKACAVFFFPLQQILNISLRELDMSGWGCQAVSTK